MTQLQITIPRDIAAPQFQLFQRVRRKDLIDPEKPRKNRVGIIVGMDYITFRAALSMGVDMGWEYVIDWVHGVSERKALNAPEVRETHGEGDLEAVEED